MGVFTMLIRDALSATSCAVVATCNKFLAEVVNFFIWKNGVRYATPLFLALVLVEASDLIFAVDSIPAIFAITTDPFIVLTSNIFAILGLRAMYFLLAGVADRFSLLKYGLAIVLMFIGVKMLLIDIYKIPVGFSLAVVAVIIGASVWASLRKEARAAKD